MSFLYPTFLYSLTAIIIPIIIHFFNFRQYKTIYFSDTRFIKNLEQETNSKNRIKHFLVLITRILIISLLVIAFARPYIPSTENVIEHQNYIVGIYIDNSFSMETEGKSGKLIELAKNNAIEIAKAYPATTKFLLSQNEYDPKLNHLLTYEQFVDQVTILEISSSTRQISEIYARQIDLLNSFIRNSSINNLRRDIYWISDGQKTTFDISEIDRFNEVKIEIILLTSQEIGNIYIDTCWFISPARIFNQSENLLVRIINNSNNNYSNFPVKLYLNDSLKSIASVNLLPNSSELVEMTFTNTVEEIIQGRIEINDYPVSYDNKLYFSYLIKNRAKILIINQNDENIFLRALFDEDEYFNLNQTKYDFLEYSNFNNYQVIILNELISFSSGFIQQIISYVSNGGTLVILPSINADFSTYNNLLPGLKMNKFAGIDTTVTKFKNISFEDKIYTNVFSEKSEKIEFPVVFSHYYQEYNNNYSQIIISLQNDKPALLTSDFKQGKTYLFTFPFSSDFSNFMLNPIFVPTLYNIALYNQRNSKLYYTIGENKNISLSNEITLAGKDNLRLTNSEMEYDMLLYNPNIASGNQIIFPSNLSRSGFYDLIQNEVKINSIAANYSRSESALEKYTFEEISSQIRTSQFKNVNLFDHDQEEISKFIDNLYLGKQLWKFFLLSALILLAIEIFLLRIMF